MPKLLPVIINKILFAHRAEKFLALGNDVVYHQVHIAAPIVLLERIEPGYLA
jgi:hypothetical protein